MTCPLHKSDMNCSQCSGNDVCREERNIRRKMQSSNDRCERCDQLRSKVNELEEELYDMRLYEKIRSMPKEQVEKELEKMGVNLTEFHARIQKTIDDAWVKNQALEEGE